MPSDPRMDVRSGAVFGLSIGICSSRVVGFVGPVAATAGGYDRRITRSRRDRCDHTDDNPRFRGYSSFEIQMRFPCNTVPEELDRSVWSRAAVVFDSLA